MITAYSVHRSSSTLYRTTTSWSPADSGSHTSPGRPRIWRTCICMFVTPILSLFGLTGLLMAYFVADGAFAIISGVRGRPEPGWGWVIVSGIASIVLAVLLWREWPASGAYAVGLLVGIRLIFSGWSIAMLGMLGDATVDVVEEAVEAVADESTSPAG